MRVLMFGWEFPPHISGGLGTACYGLTQAMLKEKDLEIIFVMPRAQGDEPSGNMKIISATDVWVPSAASGKEEKIQKSHERIEKSEKQKHLKVIHVASTLSPYLSADDFTKKGEITRWNYSFDTEVKTKSRRLEKNRKVKYKLTGKYGPDLLKEVDKYATVAAQIAAENSFDVIHAHDWLTYMAGIAAKQRSGKPLIIHVHATEFDRAGKNIDQRVFAIEQAGMQQADRIITVSNWTKRIIARKYHIQEDKISVVHNGIMPKEEYPAFKPLPLIANKIVTFFGRITQQKGPMYFVEAAQKVLSKLPDTHFVVAGSGDLLPDMLELVAHKGMSSNFHFTGFLRGVQIDKIWSISDVFVMPSVSEPFGIAPLEAVQAGVPAIISKQSGVAEVMDHAIKVDFWDTQALAKAICGVLEFKVLHNTLSKQGAEEIKEINWDKAAIKTKRIYTEMVKRNPVKRVLPGKEDPKFPKSRRMTV